MLVLVGATAGAEEVERGAGFIYHSRRIQQQSVAVYHLNT